MVVTRRDVAEAAGVSPAVVSYVLNGGPRPVSAPTRERVEAAIRDLGYRPNAIASALRGGATHTIGYLTGSNRDPYQLELGRELERKFLERGYIVLAGAADHDRRLELRYLQAFTDRRVDALILGSGVSLIGQPPIGEHDVPTVALERAPGASTATVIDADGAADAGLAVRHLAWHGHRVIGLVAGPPGLVAERDRRTGWRSAMKAGGAPYGSELVQNGDQSEEGGYLAAMQLLSRHGRPWALHGQRPTALLATSDLLAIGALYACTELGLSVPDDVAVVGLGGTKSAAFTIPPLTAVRVDIDHLSTMVVDATLAAIAGEPAERSTVAGNLLIGRSCGC